MRGVARGCTVCHAHRTSSARSYLPSTPLGRSPPRTVHLPELNRSPPRLAGEVIIFAGQRARVDALVGDLAKAGVRAAGIHGDMDQVRGWGCAAFLDMACHLWLYSVFSTPCHSIGKRQ